MVLRNRLAADLMYFWKTINPSLICWLYRALNVVDQSSRSFSSCEFLLVCFSMAVFFSVVLSFPLCGRCRSVLFCILTALLILLGFRFESCFWLMMSRATIHDHRRSDGLLRRHPATQQFPCYRLLD